jgi:voltage-gated sodium channel
VHGPSAILGELESLDCFDFDLGRDPFRDVARSVMTQSPHAWIFFVVYLLIATFMVLNLFIAVVVNAMQSQVTEDMKDEGEEHTRLILDEIRALRRQIEALRGPSQS